MERKSIFIYLSAITVIGGLLPLFFFDAYIWHLLIMTIIYAILALSLDVIIGHMGQFSFGHQAFFGLGAYTTAILIVQFDLPQWAAVSAGVALPGLFGLLVGIVALRRARGFYLGIITLGLAKIVALIVGSWSSLTGGRQGLPGVSPIKISIPFIEPITLDTELKFYYFVLCLLIIVLYIIHVFAKSRIGRAVSAIRENEELANSVGINPYKWYVTAFAFSCALAGLAGVCFAYYMKMASPTTLAHDTTLWLLIIVIVGGSRSYSGIIIGAVIYIFLPEWLVFAEGYRMILISGILLFCILFMRQGIAPTMKTFLKRKLSMA